MIEPVTLPVNDRRLTLLQSADAQTRLRAWACVLADVEVPCSLIVSAQAPDGRRFDLDTKGLYHLILAVL